MGGSAVLALESGAAIASVALIDGQGNAHYDCAESGQSHSSKLLPMAKMLMQRAGLQWQDLKGIVAGSGPGSFTGLRIACSLAQGLALGAKKEVLPVSGFEAWAYAWWLRWGEGLTKRIHLSFDARLGERFCAAILIEPAQGCLRMQWEEAPSVQSEAALATRQAQRFSEMDVWLSDPQAQERALELEPIPLAAWMARLATDSRVSEQLRWLAPSAVAPLYVRDKVAQTIAERSDFPDLSWHLMTAQDLDTVMAIEGEAYPFPWTKGNFLDSINAGYEAWLLKEHNTVIGYIVWMKVVDEAHLLNITLSPVRQGHGLGSWMMRHFLKQTQSLGFEHLMLEVRPSNPRAISLYRKFGFEQIGQRKGYYPAGPHQREDAVVMRRQLQGVTV